MSYENSTMHRHGEEDMSIGIAFRRRAHSAACCPGVDQEHLNMPAEHAEQHPKVEHRSVDARNVVADEAEERTLVVGNLG